MLRSQVLDSTWTVSLDGVPFLEHGPETPFAVALRLTLPETNALLEKAGYILSHSSKADIIVEYYINRSRYNLDEINQVLFAYDQPLLGS